MMGETTVLYVLTTLAQSCAALAAFVGALGVFRMQMLRDQQRDAARTLQDRAAFLDFGGRNVLVIPLPDLAAAVESPKERHPENPGWVQNYEWALMAKRSWEAFSPRLRWASVTLVVLEAWTLTIMGVALVGFNFIPWLKCARWLPGALLAVVAVTVLVTLGSVFVWTRR